MSTPIQLPLAIPDVNVLSTTLSPEGDLIVRVESTLKTTPCSRCGQELERLHGHDWPLRLQHLPVLEHRVYIEIRPKRFQCPSCAGGPTTTQHGTWYEPNHSYTHAFEQWVLKQWIAASWPLSIASTRSEKRWWKVFGWRS